MYIFPKYETTASYQVDANQFYTWKGLAGGAYQLILKFLERADKSCLAEGTLNVSEEDAILSVKPAARRYIGSNAWAYDKERGPSGTNTNKCNLFVYEVLNEAGTPVSMMHRTRFGFRRPDHPPLAGQWANPSVSIPGWTIVTSPQPGDVVAEAHIYSNASGHVGIVTEANADGTGKTVSASSKTQTVVENDWGFQPGQKVVFRRYQGK